MKTFYINSKFIVKPHLNEISTKETALKVAPKHMDVLELLIHHSPNPVTRDELLETVWKGTIVVEETLTRAISELRKVFGESSKNAFIIKTVPKKGYYLDATVTNDTNKVEHPKKSLNNYLFYIGIFLCLSIILIAFNVLPNKLLSKDHVLELSSRFENETSPHLSNDNLHLLTTEDSNIIIKNLDDETRNVITRSGKVIQAEWFENNLIYLVKDESYKVYKSRKDGSFSQILVDTTKPIYEFQYYNDSIYILTRSTEFNQIYLIKDTKWKLEYQTNNTILRFRVSPEIYTLEKKRNTFRIVKNGTEVYTSYKDVYDFEINKTLLLFSKQNSLTSFDMNTQVEKSVIENININRLKLNQNGFLTFTDNVPVSNLYNGEKQIYSTKRLEFHPVINDKDSLLAFISTRCGFYNIWLADLNTEKVLRKTFFKYGYIQNFTWDQKKNIIYYVQYRGKECFLKSINLQNESANISKKLDKTFDSLMFYDGKLFGKSGKNYFIFNLQTYLYSQTSIVPERAVRSKTIYSKQAFGKNDIYGIDLSDYL